MRSVMDAEVLFSFHRPITFHRRVQSHAFRRRLCCLPGIGKPRAQYEEFFSLWKSADPDGTILKQAKAEFGERRGFRSLPVLREFHSKTRPCSFNCGSFSICATPPTRDLREVRPGNSLWPECNNRNGSLKIQETFRACRH